MFNNNDNTLLIDLKGPPTPQGRPRIARRGAYAHAYDPNAKDKKRITQKAMALIAEKTWIVADTDEYAVTIKFHVPFPANDKKRNLASWSQSATSKPDLDNLAKFYLDALNNLAWFDDQQITSLHLIKKYSSQPNTAIYVTKKTQKKIPQEHENVMAAISRDEVEEIGKSSISLIGAANRFDEDPCEANRDILVEAIKQFAGNHAPTLQRIKRLTCRSKQEKVKK